MPKKNPDDGVVRARFEDFDDLEGVTALLAYQEQSARDGRTDFVVAKHAHRERVWNGHRVAEDWQLVADGETEFIFNNRLPHRYEDFVRHGREDVYWRFRFTCDWGTAEAPGSRDDWDWPYPSWKAKADAERCVNQRGFLAAPRELSNSPLWRPLARYIETRYGTTSAYVGALGWEHAHPPGRPRCIA